MNKEERIESLRRGIASPETPEHLRAEMQSKLDELTAPEPPPAPELPSRQVRVKKAPPQVLPPPPREFTEEEKAERLQQYRNRLNKKKNRSK